jgi:hypothetical protein
VALARCDGNKRHRVVAEDIDDLYGDVVAEEAVSLRERLALLDGLDEVALLGVGELVAVGVGGYESFLTAASR